MEKAITKSKEIPAQLRSVTPKNLQELLNALHVLSENTIETDRVRVYDIRYVYGDGIIKEGEYSLSKGDKLNFIPKKYGFKENYICLYEAKNFAFIPLLWFDSDGQGWKTQANMALDPKGHIYNFHFMRWEKATELLPIKSVVSSTVRDCARVYYVINSPREMDMILLANNPDGYSFLKKEKVNKKNGIFTPASLLMAPQIESLYRYGYLAFTRWHLVPFEQADYTAINLLTQPGDSEEKVFPFPPEFREKMKRDPKPEEWIRYALRFLYESN